MATINQENTSAPASNAKRRAAAYINVTVVGKGGKTKQLGGVPLYADNELHAKIIEHAQAGNEIVVETGMHIVESADDFEL